MKPHFIGQFDLLVMTVILQRGCDAVTTHPSVEALSARGAQAQLRGPEGCREQWRSLEPLMSLRPPRRLEIGVGRLLPSTGRAHVPGDLSERYRLPVAYAQSALGVLPLTATQVRRTAELRPWTTCSRLCAAPAPGGVPRRQTTPRRP
jgi:hypothetical protein